MLAKRYGAGEEDDTGKTRSLVTSTSGNYIYNDSMIFASYGVDRRYSCRLLAVQLTSLDNNGAM
jgi:hypothetical protein